MAAKRRPINCTNRIRITATCVLVEGRAMTFYHTIHRLRQKCSSERKRIMTININNKLPNTMWERRRRLSIRTQQQLRNGLTIKLNHIFTPSLRNVERMNNDLYIKDEV